MSDAIDFQFNMNKGETVFVNAEHKISQPMPKDK